MKPLLTPLLKKRRNRLTARFAYGDILDLGCGSGEVLLYLENRGKYVGVDKEHYRIEGLSQRVDTSNAVILNGDLESQRIKDILPEGSYDSVLLVAVIEHLEDPARLLAQIREVIKPHGRLIVTTPSPTAEALHTLLARAGLTHKDAVRQHHRLFGKKDLVLLMASQGFRPYAYKRFEMGLNQLLVCVPY